VKTWSIFPKNIELLDHYYCCYGKVLKWHPKMGHQFSKHSQIWRALFQIHIGVVFWFKNDLSLVNKKTYLKDDERWGTIIRWSCTNKIPGFSNYACWLNEWSCLTTPHIQFDYDDWFDHMPYKPSSQLEPKKTPPS
jgi:hypothetical protein